MFNATETRKMHKSAIQVNLALSHKDYHFSVAVLLVCLRQLN